MTIPRIERDLIGALGLTDRVRELATKEQLNTHQIIERLVEDPDVRDRLVKMGDVKIYATDIYKAIVQDLGQKAAILGDTVGSEAETALVVQSAKERALGVIQMGREFDAIASRAMALLSVELDAYEEVKNGDDEDLRKMARFPHALIDTTRKAVLGSLQFAKAFMADPQVQGLIRAQTVNLNHGISQEELHDILFAVGEQLGVPRDKMVTAYTKALVARKRRKSAERGGAVDTPAMPKFTQALEQSSGIAPAPAEA